MSRPDEGSRARRPIPGIVHQTWETNQIPEEWRTCVQSWREHHPDWEYRLWTAEDRESFVAREHPDFLSTYKNYSNAIQRADVSRYLILYTYGGVYADLDLECLRPFDSLLDGWSFVLGAEPLEYCMVHRARVVCNAFLAAAAGHPFLAQVIDTLRGRAPRILTPGDVVASTGPLFLTNVLLGYQESELCILEPDILYPLTWNSADLKALLRRDSGCAQLREQLVSKGSYTIHYWASSWHRDPVFALRNPEPHNVPGYKFYPGLDSVGRDIRNVGRDIQILAAECDKDGTAVAFNTDGFLKYSVWPRSSWSRKDNPQGNEGLYVKTGWRRVFRSLRKLLFSRNRP